MRQRLIQLHVDDAGRQLRPYSRLREALRVAGVVVLSLFAVFSLWCFAVLVTLLMGG
jgi:hypothetical protein